MYNSSTENAALCHRRIQMKRIVIPTNIGESFHILIRVKVILKTIYLPSSSLNSDKAILLEFTSCIHRITYKFEEDALMRNEMSRKSPSAGKNV